MIINHRDGDPDLKIIIDTSVWIDYFLNRPTPQIPVLEHLLEIGADIVIPDLVLCEILQGCRTDAEISRVDSFLTCFEIVTTGGAESARLSARNYRRLRRQGKTVRSTIDCLIATYAIEMNCVLLHNDRDYDVFEKNLDLHVLQ